MGMPEMEISEEEEPWILSKPTLITVAMRWCLHKEVLGKVRPKSATCNGLFFRWGFLFVGWKADEPAVEKSEVEQERSASVLSVFCWKDYWCH